MSHTSERGECFQKKGERLTGTEKARCREWRREQQVQRRRTCWDRVRKQRVDMKGLKVPAKHCSQQISFVYLKKCARDEDEGVQLLGAKGETQVTANVAATHGNYTLQQQQHS
jgi:hypothetical protein